jgi:hypothetical protein
MSNIKIDTGNLKGTTGGIEYTWAGGFGGVITSKERNVPLGSVRMIGNTVFYAISYSYDSGFWRKTINWVPQEEISSDWIREFKQAFFR